MNWYKATGPGGNAMFGTGTWNLPTDDGPGEWMPYLPGELKMCSYGYHVTDAAHVVEWLGPEMYLAEVDPRGVLIADTIGRDKWLTPKARLVKKLSWDDETTIQFIEDCHQHVRYPDPTYKNDALVAINHQKLDRCWDSVDRFLGWCRTVVANRDKEFLWQNQRLLMYLHGAIA